MDTYQFKYLLLECLRDDKFRKAVEDLLNGEEPSLDWVDDYLLNLVDELATCGGNKNIKI